MSMVRTFIARDALQAHFVRNLLEGEGIDSAVLGEELQQIGGAIPVQGTAPAVWVAAQDEDAAAAVVRNFQNAKTRQIPRLGQPWRCGKCGELLEAQFTDCWNCGAARPSGAAPVELEPVDPDAPMEFDVPCIDCEYNLRGLIPRGKCPECGQPIVPSLLAMITDLSPQDYVDV